jgi:uncharacterized protein (DUF2235 family)
MNIGHEKEEVMPKNIVICCDGTGNVAFLGDTNVARIYQVAENNTDRQRAWYDPGVGTSPAAWARTPAGRTVTRIAGLLFGYGITENVRQAYHRLMSWYEPDDRIFLFGFSRGAYTVRMLASAIHMFGLLRWEDRERLPEMIAAFRFGRERRFAAAAEFRAKYSRVVPIHFAGVWDTVSSVGFVSYAPLRLPYTADNPSITIARHAISIDERRCFYRTNRFDPKPAKTDLKQVWFAGVHSDVGGGYKEAEGGLSKLALEWMIGEARDAGLLVSQRGLEEVLGGHDSGLSAPDPGAKLHRLQLWWRILEILPKRRWRKAPGRDGADEWRSEWIIPLWRARTINAGETIHWSVAERMRRLGPGYAPKNLPPGCLEEPKRQPPAA